MTNKGTSHDDFLAEMAERDRLEHPLHRWLRNRGLFAFLHSFKEYGGWHMFRVHLVDPVKYFFQRLTRGYDDSCTWSLDHHLAKIILPRLKLFREQPHGCPTDMSNVACHRIVSGGEEDPELAAWNEKLDKMIYAFDYIASGREWGSDPDWTIEKERAEDLKVAEGLELFGKYFRGLWN